MNESAKVTIEDVSIHMSSTFLNDLVKWNRKLIDMAINDAVIPYLEKLLTGEVELVNKMVSNEGPYTFYSPMFGDNIGMNFTMTSAPEMVGSTDLAKIYFDGLFVLPENSTRKPIIDFHKNLKNYPVHELHSLSQQFWLNQDMFNSWMEINP